MSVLLIGCCRPVTLGSLLSWPSIMTLFDRSRAPFDEKFASAVPEAKLVCPLASSLTPGAERASVKMFRLPITGSSATLRVEADAHFRVRRIQQRRICGDLDHLGERGRPDLHVDNGNLVDRKRDPGTHVAR